MFTPLEIQARVRRMPFIPFQVVTSAGEVHSVTHPELIIVGQRFVTIGFGTPQFPLIAELETRVAIIHITELRDLPTPAPASSNGA
jgi:hypothetical protein